MNKAKSRCDAARQAYAGSQRQVQFDVNNQPRLLNEAIVKALGDPIRLQWVSRLAMARYREYRDTAFLNELSLIEFSAALRMF